MFKKLMVAALMLIVLISVVFAQEATVQYNSVTFSYLPESFGAVLPGIEEGTPYQADAPYFANTAPHTTFFFTRPNPALPEIMFTGQLRIYKIADLETYGEPSYMQVVELLRNFDTSTLSDYANVDFGAAALPFMPVVNAAQVFRTHPAELDFANVNGIQYYTYYSQAVDPIIEGQIMYAYQGITTDGLYYMSFSMPVETGLLDTTIPQDMDYEAFSANYETYLQETFTKIRDADPEKFTPSASDLSGFIESIGIE